MRRSSKVDVGVSGRDTHAEKITYDTVITVPMHYLAETCNSDIRDFDLRRTCSRFLPNVFEGIYAFLVRYSCTHFFVMSERDMNLNLMLNITNNDHSSIFSIIRIISTYDNDTHYCVPLSRYAKYIVTAAFKLPLRLALYTSCIIISYVYRYTGNEE